MTLHPVLVRAQEATHQWWEQREKCRKCQNYLREGGAELCVLPGLTPQLRTVSCIDRRAPGASCGPDARSFILNPWG